MKKLLGCLLVIAALAAMYVHRTRSAPSTFTTDEWPTEHIEFGAIAETVSASGTIQAKDQVTIGCEAAGRVVKVLAEPGQSVNASDILCQLDDRLATLRLQQAKIAVELAQADVQRAEASRDAAALAAQQARDGHGQIQPVNHVETAEFHRRGAEATVKAAQLKVREAQTAQQLAELAVDQTIVRAPAAGMILDKRCVTNQLVAPPLSAQLFTMAPSLEHMQVVMLAAEGDVGKLRVGQNASFTVSAWPEQSFTGRISRIVNLPVPSPGAVQYPVSIDVTNSKDASGREWKLRPGLPAAVDVVIRRHEQVWRLPAAALNVQLDEARLSDGARKKLGRWKSRSDRGDWQRVWQLTTDRGPWPIYVRTSGKTALGDSGIQDAEHVEITSWDPEESTPTPASPPRVLVGVPDSAKPAKPGLKLF